MIQITPLIAQIFYKDAQRLQLDPAFQPYDNSQSTSELREFFVFEELFKNPAFANQPLWGALSWRFQEKTGLTGDQYIQRIQAKPSFDVYFCNPYPVNEALFQNMWLQGNTTHTQFLEVAAAFFKAAKLNPQELTAIAHSSQFSATNSFVGTPAFWSAYIPFIKRILEDADKNLPKAFFEIVHSPLADPRNLHSKSTYIPFIIERLFPHFMATDGKHLKACKIETARDQDLNTHLKTLRAMKDNACETKSKQLASYWINYRNLYLNFTHSKEWCEKHLPTLTHPPKSNTL